MRPLLFFATVAFSLSTYAQTSPDVSPRESQGANTEGSALDPASKARVRTEGSTGGLEGGMKTEEQKDRRGGASSGQGRPQRSRQGLEGDAQGRTHNETSSDREEGRGARGAIR